MRRKSNEQLSTASEQLSLAIRSAELGLWNWDVKQNQLFWDDHMYELYGIAKEDFSGAYEAWTKGVHPYDRKRSDDEIQQALKGEKDFDTEFRVVWPDGTVHYIEAHGDVYRDASGNPIRMIGVNLDITKRKKGEEELRERVKQLDCLYGISSIVEKDDSLKAIYNGTVNILRDSWQYPEIARARIIIDNTAFVSDDFRESAYRQCSDIFVFGEQRGLIEVFYLEAKPDRDEGPFLLEERRLINAVAERLGRITERKKAEEELKQLKQDFASMIVHDLRSPITSIKGFSQMMALGKLGPLSDKQGEAVSIINDAAGKQLALINDYLDLSKIESGQIHIDSEFIDIGLIVDSAIRLVKIQAELKNINLSSRIDESLLSLSGDSSKLEQVLINLLTNAVKFTPHNGSIVLSVTTDQDGNNVQVSVSDTGVGITADELVTVFDKYRQARTGKKLEQKGTGLGLAISKLIIEAHGGKIWAESKEGKGSTFYFTIPTGK